MGPIYNYSLGYMLSTMQKHATCAITACSSSCPFRTGVQTARAFCIEPVTSQNYCKWFDACRASFVVGLAYCSRASCSTAIWARWYTSASFMRSGASLSGTPHQVERAALVVSCSANAFMLQCGQNVTRRLGSQPTAQAKSAIMMGMRYQDAVPDLGSFSSISRVSF